MKPDPDAASALLRALAVTVAPLDVTALEVRSKSWNSATFSGGRHQLTLRIAGGAAQGAGGATEALLERLQCRDFNLPGHIVADFGLLDEARRDGEDFVTVRLDVLTLERK
jgi:hypothetical protein